MRKKNTYENLYRINPTDGHVIIDISLDFYLQFFHEWDNAMFKKRDMHPDLARFLDNCSSEIPTRKPIDIVFCIKDGTVDAAKEAVIRESFGNYYRAKEREVRKQLKRNFLFGLALFCIAIAFLSVYVLDKASRPVGLFSNLFLEGLLIGGWVFMWEALHMFFLESLEPFSRRRELKRFLRSDLLFRSATES
jgi:hypothetical protein